MYNYIERETERITLLGSVHKCQIKIKLLHYRLFSKQLIVLGLILGR